MSDKINYLLKRSNRKTVSIYIKGCIVEVRAPLYLSINEIDSFVTSKSSWIRNKLLLSNERLRRKDSFHISYGQGILYRGQEYKIVAKEGAKVYLENDVLIIPTNLSPVQIKSAIIELYRLGAKKYLFCRAIELAEQMSVSIKSIKISNARTRWGSCSIKNRLNFSWRLIMAEDSVIDYILVHELAHIKEMNHSKRFWDIVESILPDFRQRQTKLKALQTRLRFEDWD